MTTEEFRRQNIDCGSATGQSISSTSKLQAKKKKERERDGRIYGLKEF